MRAELMRMTRLVGFFGRLAIKEHLVPGLHVRPLVGELFLTENCNLRCRSCACWRKTTREEMSTSDWRQVIEQLADLRFIKLNFTGGEPLLRQDAAELMAHARDLGVPDLHLNTNGILLTDRRRAEVLEAGIRSFNISLDGPDPESHDALRGREGAFRTTLSHLQALLREGESTDIAVRICFTVMKDNLDQVPAMAALASRLGVRLYLNLARDSPFLFGDPEASELARVDQSHIDDMLRRLEPRARGNPRHLPDYAQLRYLRTHFVDRLQAAVPCAESQLKLMIDSRGGVGGCWGHEPEHDMRSHRIAEIVDGPRYRERHAAFFCKQCRGCGSNYALNLRWRPRNHLEGAFWRLGRLHLVPEVS